MTDTQIDNRYAPPLAVVADTHDSSLEMVPAERLTRFFAVLIDAAPGFVFGVIAAMAGAASFFARKPTHAMAPTFVLFASVGGIAMLAYLIYTIVLVYRYGQTFGKRMLGIRVVRMDGRRVSFPRFLFLRFLAIGVLGSIPYIGWLISLSDPLLIFRDSRRCLHDQLADTQVVTAASSPNATLAGSREDFVATQPL